MCHVTMGGVTRCDDGWSDQMCHVMMGGVTRCRVTMGGVTRCVM